MEIFYVYILYSKALDRYYVGSTNNIYHRLVQHNTKHKGFTSAAIDWELMYSEEYTRKEKALEREKEIKRWKSKKMLEKIISSAG